MASSGLIETITASAANILIVLLPTRVGSVKAHALKNHRPKDGIYTTGVFPSSC
jgi:hypothetical protein